MPWTILVPCSRGVRGLISRRGQQTICHPGDHHKYNHNLRPSLRLLGQRHGGSNPRDGSPKATELLAKISSDCLPSSVGGDGSILREGGILRDRSRRASMLHTTLVPCSKGERGPSPSAGLISHMPSGGPLHGPIMAWARPHVGVRDKMGVSHRVFKQ